MQLTFDGLECRDDACVRVEYVTDDAQGFHVVKLIFSDVAAARVRYYYEHDREGRISDVVIQYLFDVLYDPETRAPVYLWRDIGEEELEFLLSIR